MAELATAYVTIAPKMQGFQGAINKEINGINSGGFSGKMSLMQGAVAGFAAAVTTKAITALGSFTQELGKSFTSYAEWEQLVGGVDTLFKDSSGKLQQYAQDAYKAQQISANDYMSLATSFSASLLQSLDGDTEAAVEAANLAITDMSDNASKMGSSMESIQNAYNGFAKANYTMLDNLKLGYGGTKEEMQRLLDDASKLAGVEFDISSYADIVEAIHVVQQEMGIAGTTALEAATTIEGSTNMAKAAWNNWLAELGKDNADMVARTEELVNSVAGMVKNALPRIIQIAKTALGALPQVVSELVAALVSSFSEAFDGESLGLLESVVSLFNVIVDALVDLGPKLLERIPALVVHIVQGLQENLPSLLDGAVKLFGAMETALLDVGNKLVRMLPWLVDNILSFILDNGAVLLSYALEFFLQFVEGMLQMVPTLVERLPQIVDTVVTFLIDSLPALVDASVQLFQALIIAIPEICSQLWEATPQIIDTIAQGIVNGLEQIANAGRDLIGGLWNGMLAAKDWLINKVKELCGGVLDTIKGFFGIHSPSRVMADMGGFLMDGFGIGIEDEADVAVGAMESAAEAIYNAAGIDALSAGYNVSASLSGASAVDEMTARAAYTGDTVTMGDLIFNVQASDPEGVAREVFGIIQQARYNYGRA